MAKSQKIPATCPTCKTTQHVNPPTERESVECVNGCAFYVSPAPTTAPALVVS